MSMGSKIVTLRIEINLLCEMEAAIESQNFHTKGEPLSVSAWIRKTIQDKLKHLERARNWKKKKPASLTKREEDMLDVDVEETNAMCVGESHGA